MDYKKVMGYGKTKVKKKKIVKEVKRNKVLDSIKEEFGYKDELKEVGASAQHQDMLKDINKAEENLHKYVQLYKNFLMDQGQDKLAKEFSSKYIGFIGKFTNWMKTKWVKILRKLI